MVKTNFKVSKDWKNGLKMGFKVAKAIAKKQGYEIIFPDVDEIIIERGK